MYVFVYIIIITCIIQNLLKTLKQKQKQKLKIENNVIYSLYMTHTYRLMIDYKFYNIFNEDYELKMFYYFNVDFSMK